MNELDLLKKRREDAGIEAYDQKSTENLKKKGVKIGFSLVSLGVFVCISTIFYNIKLETKKNSLIALSNEYNVLKLKFQKEIKSLRELYKSNDSIAQGIAGIRSGSAILSEIKAITPQTIQLKSIESKKNNLKLKGIAYQPYGLDSINNYKLQVEESLFIDNKNVYLERAWETNQQILNSKDNKKELKFKINSNFYKLNNYNLLIPYLNDLGSKGLAKRITILKQEGLIQ